LPKLAISLCALITVIAPCRAESDLVSEWKRQMAIRLGEHERVPAEACRQGGEATLALSLDRNGKLISAEIVKSSGVPMLDKTALTIARSAQPFPPPPTEIGDSNARFEAVLVFVKSAESGKPSEMTRRDQLLEKRLHSICRGC
jgi:protein TonB